MDKTIKIFCELCQQSKINRHSKTPIQSLAIPAARFYTVYVNIVGPLLPAKNTKDPYNKPFHYILTYIFLNWTKFDNLLSNSKITLYL